MLLGMILGAIAGFFYQRGMGCSTGTCMITSSPLNSSVYGAFMGALAGDIFKRKQY